MEGMLADLAINAEQRAAFERHVGHKRLKIDFTVQLLTRSSWPVPKSPALMLTDEMSSCMAAFNSWHESKHQKGRRLDWVIKHGSATVRATFGTKFYDVQVTALQAVAMNAMNGGKTVSFTELARKLHLQQDVLKPLMHSLSCGKYQVITKIPAGKKVNRTDTFIANAKFKSKERKFRIPMASLDATLSQPKIQVDRRHAIEAAIVRIMKARKTLAHTELMAEVMKQLQFFQPEPKVVKQSIEHLIGREYLELGSSADSQTYNHLA